MIKKFLFTLMTAILTVTPVYAAESTPSATLSVVETESADENTVTVSINLSEVTYAGYQMEICYDADVLTPMELLPGANGAPINNLEAEGTHGPCVKVAYASLDESTGNNDAMFSIKFYIKDTSASTTGITLEEVMLFDSASQDIPVTVENGIVQISNTTDDTSPNKSSAFQFPVRTIVITVAVLAVLAGFVIVLKKRN